MKTKIVYILVLVLVSLFVPITFIAISTANETHTSTEKPEEKFKVGPTIRFRPVVDVIEKEQDAIVELYMENPSPNDGVILHVEVQVSVPSGLHIYSEKEEWTVAYGIAYIAHPFEIYPGKARVVTVHIKADENARIGQHTLYFNGLYYPGTNEKYSSSIALSFPITVKEPSKEIPPSSMLIPTSPESASVYLHGERTSVTAGEDIILSLSAINLITKPTMTLQLILKVPSGMSTSSAEFVESGAGQYTATYTIEPGKERHIGVNIKTNEHGDFTVVGTIVYYFGDVKSNAEYKTVTLPVKVNPESTSTETTPTSSQTETSGFEAAFVIAALLAVAYLVGLKK